jgi:hypothetical protein
VGEIRDLVTLRQELVEHCQLVFLAAPDQVLEADVELPRRPPFPPRRLQIQLGQLLTGQEMATSLADSRSRPSVIFIGPSPAP